MGLRNYYDLFAIKIDRANHIDNRYPLSLLFFFLRRIEQRLKFENAALQFQAHGVWTSHVGPINRGLLLRAGRLLLDQRLPLQGRQEKGRRSRSSLGMSGTSRYILFR
jgi:hypothetical protein